MGDTVLAVEALSKRFRRGERHNALRDLVPAVAARLLRRTPAPDRRAFWSLRDVSFEVQRGEAFGIIGGNGAGKSTILKLLTGIMKPTRGTIRLFGRISALIEISAGFHRELTGRENIFLYGAIMGMTRQEIRHRFDAIVAFSGLEDFIDTPVKRYSSGMFARLGFSVAAHVDPDIMLVDEVLSVGDYLFQRKCIDHMNAVISRGATVIFVSHQLSELASLCRRSLLLERGQVQLVGPTEDVIRTYFRRGQAPRASDPAQPIRITRVSVHGADGPSLTFSSGQKAYVTVEAEARARREDLSVVVQIVDDHQYPMFDTCTQRLDAGPLTLDEGQTLQCTFELQLLLAGGTYHVNAFLHRYVVNRPHDRWLGAATFFVKDVPEVRGPVNLLPRLVRHAAGDATSASAIPMLP